MDDRERRLAFTREDVVGSEVTKRIELEGVDAASVHRTLERRLAGTDRLASFETAVLEATSTEGERPDGDPDRFEGRLSAVRGRAAEDGTIEYRPYGPHGAMAMLLGAIFALPSLFVTLALVVAGYAVYRIERPADVPLERVTTVDVHVSETSPGSADREPGSAGDGAATVRVVAAAEPGYAVDADRAGDLEWPHRKAILARVRDWSGRALSSDPELETGEDAFFAHLNMWRNRNAESDVAAIDDEQRRAFADRERRAAYAARVRKRLEDDEAGHRPEGDDARERHEGDDASHRLEPDEDDAIDATRELEDLVNGLAAELDAER